MAHRIIIDTDPGIDDIMTIFFALQSPEVEVLGLTSVFGNGGAETTGFNAIRVVETAGHPEIPVALGADAPLFIPKRSHGGATVHREDGLGNAGDRLPKPKGKPLDKRAATFIIETVMAHLGEITLVPIGPLTNIALAARIEPRIVQNVKSVVLMGGSAFAGGNITAAAEANICNDPHAADIVFSAGWPIVMAGWDVSERFIMSQAYMDELSTIGNPATSFIKEIYPHLRDFLKLPSGGIDVPDLMALAYLVDPSLFTVQRYPVYVETEGRSAGQTVADRRLHPRGEIGAEVDLLLDVDAERLQALYMERLRQYSK